MPYPLPAVRGNLGEMVAPPQLPFSDAFTRADGALGNGWIGATWTIASNAITNTPTLGAELFLNPDFAADTNWTKGTGWTIAGGVASHASGATSSLLEFGAIVGGWFRIVWTLQNYSAGVFQGRPGINMAGRSANGTYTDNGHATVTTAGITAQTTAVGDVDNLSLRQLTLATLFATQNFGRADVDASVKLTIAVSNSSGLVLSLDSTSSPANFVVAYHDGTNAIMEKCVSGTYTVLISTAAAYVANAPIRLTKVGTTYTLYYNGVQRGTPQTVSDAGIIGNMNHGVMNTYELNTLDTFSIVAN